MLIPSDDLMTDVMYGFAAYRGWRCTFLGTGCAVFSNYTTEETLTFSSEKDRWVLDCWEQFIAKIGHPPAVE